MMKKNILFIVVLFLVLLFAPPSYSTEVIQAGLRILTGQSDVIIHGKVTGIKSQQSKTGHVFTLTSIQVLTGVKGAKKGEVVTVYQPGGEVDGMRQWVSGATRFKTGEEIVLFGEKFKDYIVVSGAGIGKFIVKKGRGKKKTLVEDTLQNITAYVSGDDGIARLGAPEQRRFKSLEKFIALIKEYMVNPVPDDGMSREKDQKFFEVIKPVEVKKKKGGAKPKSSE